MEVIWVTFLIRSLSTKNGYIHRAYLLSKTMKLELGIDDLAKYPFLKEAGKHIQKMDLRIEDLKQQDYSQALKRAKGRIREAIRNAAISSEISEPDIEIISFPLALILVRATNSEHLIARYSLAEAIRAEKLLRNEDKKMISFILEDDFGIELESIEERFDFAISILDYLKRATQFHETEWKLINRVIDRGFVYLETRDVIRLIREEVRKRIYEKIVNAFVPKLPEDLMFIVNELNEISRTTLVRKERIETVPDRFPPCIAYVVNLLQKGQNIPHYGRFLMTTYFINTGRSIDDIISMSGKTPDFNEGITRYQVEHIAGMRGGRTR